MKIKKFFTLFFTFLCLLVVGASIKVGAESTVFTASTVVNNTGYQKYENDDWVVTCGGNNKSIGSNSNKSSQLKLGTTYAYVGEPLSLASDSTYVAAVISLNKLSNVTTISYTYNGGAGSCTSTTIYVVSSSSKESGYAKVGEGQQNATSLTFTVNSSEDKYYAIVFKASGWFRIDDAVITFEYVDASVTYDTLFNYNDGSATPQVDTVKTKENESVVFPAAPTREGYLFSGWYDAAEGGNLVTELTATSANNNKTLYAHWTVDNFVTATMSFGDDDKLTSGSGYAPYNGQHIAYNSVNTTKKEFTYTSSNVMLQSGNMQFQKNSGYVVNDTMVKGAITTIILNGRDSSISSFEVYTASEKIATPSGTALTGTNGVYDVSESNNHSWFYIKMGSATGKVTSISVKYIPNPAYDTFDIKFDANGGEFAAGVGETITKQSGQTEEVTLPTASDMASTLYNGHSVLDKWTDGTNNYEPGAKVSVTDETTFTAVYKEKEEVITLATAKEICDSIEANVKTSLTFVGQGLVTSIVSSQTSDTYITFVMIDASTDTTFTCYKANIGEDLVAVGDMVQVVGKLEKYNSTYEFVDASYQIGFAGSKFMAVKTMTSLKVDYAGSLQATNVDLRFGGFISEDLYVEGAKYGVLVFAGESQATFNDKLSSYDSAEALVNANTGVKKVECTPAKVVDGYQFAWVITDMEGHYTQTMTAVLYMEYNGVLYLCDTKTTSVVDAAEYYFENSEELELTAEQAEVCMNIATADYDEE